jgi:hypothetical protein
MEPASTQSTSSEEKYLEVLRRLGPVGRLNAAFGLFDFAREHLTVNLRREHPDWTADQVRAVVRERLSSIQ